MNDNKDIDPVTIQRKQDPSWWDVEITPMRLILAMITALFAGMSLAMLLGG